MAKKGMIIYRGDSGRPKTHYAKSTVDNVIDNAALTVLKTALNSYTDCNPAKQVFSESTLLVDAAPVTNANVDYRGTVYFRHPTTLKVHSFTLPAIAASAVEMKDEGERIKTADVSTIVAAIATATGIAYTPLYGVVEQSR